MRTGSTRYCGGSACRKPFVVERGDFFVTCPDCRLYFQGGNLGARQLLPHARQRKLMGGEGKLMPTVADHNEVV